MKLEQIEQVVEVARQSSISQAAMNLFISQPSLSLSIQHLEEELGEALFVRSNKGVRLTPFGKQFVSYAEAILEQTRQLSDLGRKDGHRNRPSLSVVNGGFRFVTDAYAKLYHEHRVPGIDLNVGDSIGYDIIDLVADGFYEIGVTRIWKFQSGILRRLMRQKGVQFFPLVQVPLSVVVGRGSPLFHAPSDTVTREDLAGFPLVTYSYLCKGPFSGILREAEIPPASSRIVVASRSSCFEVLDTTPAYYISATSQSAYQHTDYYPNARSLRLADCDITAEIGWIKQEERHLSPLANEFVRILSSYFD